MHVAAPPPPPDSASAKARLFLERFGHMMSRVVLTVLYVLLVAPPGIVYALFLDPLRAKRRPTTNWVPWKSANDTVDAARRQA